MKKILVIWANSKVWNKFIEKFNNKYYFLKTWTKKVDLADTILDLSDKSLIESFFNNLDNKKFDSVIFFASMYEKDNFENIDSILNQITVNSTNIIYFLNKLIEDKYLLDNAKILFFTDAGTQTPKEWFISYSLSKDILKSFVSSFARKYDKYIFLWFDLWPVYTDKTWEEKKLFYNKSLLKLKNPVDGLINFLDFVINEENFFSTGSIVDFSWWTYLKRCYIK